MEIWSLLAQGGLFKKEVSLAAYRLPPSQAHPQVHSSCIIYILEFVQPASANEQIIKTPGVCVKSRQNFRLAPTRILHETSGLREEHRNKGNGATLASGTLNIQQHLVSGQRFPGYWLRGRLIATVVQHQLFFLGEINLAVVALKIFVAASFRLQLPARNRKIKHCWAILAFFFSTVTNFPAGGKGQELLYSGNIKPVFMNQLTETPEPFQVVVRKEPLAAAPGWLDQTLTLIDSQGAGMDTQKLSNNANRIKGFVIIHINSS
jgi:hypothetical protein